MRAIREQVAAERGNGSLSDGDRLLEVQRRLEGWTGPGLRPVINASGVVLHTNLGRAPLAASAAEAAARAARGYSNLELDLRTGRRGSRSAATEQLFSLLTGAPAALAVNNNAAAVLLALTALCARREVIVSRGQQVEIGGSFRMPDVMRLSGARMVEVGTTNRTRLEDYEKAITSRSAALLRVHTSNFQVTGFTESPALADLAELAHRRGLLLLDDLGSGALLPLGGEPTVGESLAAADVVMFSGDKLVGGPQAGILLGAPDLIGKMSSHALARALRIDKMTAAALEETLRLRLLGRDSEVPVHRMLQVSAEDLRRRAALWVVKLTERDVPARLLRSESLAGGGSLPGTAFPTWVVAIEHSPSRLAERLRHGDPAVLARIESDACFFDPRTVLDGEDELLLDAIVQAWSLGQRKRR